MIFDIQTASKKLFKCYMILFGFLFDQLLSTNHVNFLDLKNKNSNIII